MPTHHDPKNTYDRRDIIKREAVIIAEGLKVAAYRVRDPETQEWSTLQFHMTYNNNVMAVMSQESATLFARFVNSTLGVHENVDLKGPADDKSS